ncbi:MAG: hypothetical protein AVDCRST_MAG19-2217, partial [uncultured Thermomicrobiales bacterium]
CGRRTTRHWSRRRGTGTWGHWR